MKQDETRSFILIEEIAAKLEAGDKSEQILRDFVEIF